MAYQLLIDLAALELLMRQPSARKRRFIEHLHLLRLYPAAHSDYRTTDVHGRLVQVSILDGFAIYYWIDEADRHVKILEISAADEGRNPQGRA
jgi:hypothetical protein